MASERPIQGTGESVVHVSEQATVTVIKSPQTALHRAAMVGSRDGVAALIKGGCALDLQDKDGNTALHEVSWHGFSQCVKLLVKAGADVHIKNKAFSLSAFTAMLKLPDAVMDRLSILEQHTEPLTDPGVQAGALHGSLLPSAGHTALHLACQNGHCQSARLLLLGGSRPDSKNHVGDTCLHIAARYNQLAMIKILLGALCSVAEKNETGDTALHVAAALNHKKTVNLLLEAGADSYIKNNAGQTTVDKAREQNHRDVAELLSKADQSLGFARVRTVRRRRELLKTARRAQSVPRDDVPAGKESTSVAEDTHSSDQALNKRIELVSKAVSSPRNRRKLRRLKNRVDLHVKRESPRRRARSASPLGEDDMSLPNGKAYQLYTLYRDKDGTIKQAPANDCHCKPLIKKLENQLKSTKMEIRSQIYNIHEEMNSKLGRMDRQSKQQIKVLQKMAQERVSVEGVDCLYRINQRATIERLNEEKRQAKKASELKNWYMSKIQDIEVRLPRDPQYFKLLPSPSVDQSLLETDPECLPLLSVVSEESTSSLATYVNVLPSPGLPPYSTTRGSDFDEALGRKYFEVKLDSSSAEDHQNHSELCSTMVRHKSFSRSRPVSGDPQWLPVELQEMDASEAQASQGNGDEFCLSTPSESLSPCSRPPEGDSDLDEAGAPGWRLPRQHVARDRIVSRTASLRRPCGGGSGGSGNAVQTLEFFSEHSPAEMSFIQERDNLHAIEVTQRFFETVSTQLERWYERKILEAQRMAEQRAQMDRAALMERINCLEDELQNLRANTHS